MPTYEYDCAECGDFDMRRTIAERDAPLACPYCGGEAMRVMRSAPSLGSLAGDTRIAHARNERSAHEPKRSSSHGPSCGCCAKPKFPRADAAAQSAPRTAGGRPWMISH